jgi:ArsR family transcriptional regulator
MTVRELLPVIDAATCCAPLVRDILPAGKAENLARSLKALADPARLRIISIIAAHEDNDVCACDFTGPLGLGQPTVSHHLKTLVDAGFINRTKRGTWAHYTLVPGALDAVAALFAE